MNETSAIVFKDIEQSKSNFKLGPVTLEIPRGLITAIVGPNGSGKSSLFRMALDLVKPDKGHIRMLDETVGGGMDQQLKQRIGYLAEESPALDSVMKGSGKAEFHRNWYPEWDVNRYQELLRLFQVNDQQALGKMSKGMRRKFEFSLALAHNPELLLLDEPSSGLDPLAWKSMIEVLHRYMEQGERTILMTTHIVEEVKRLADIIVFMVQGKVLGVYEKDELFSSWFTYYVSGEQLTAPALKAMPGECGIEHAGGAAYRVTTDKALEAKRWCESQGLSIISANALELDEIMSTLMEQNDLGIRLNDRRGLKV